MPFRAYSRYRRRPRASSLAHGHTSIFSAADSPHFEATVASLHLTSGFGFQRSARRAEGRKPGPDDCFSLVLAAGERPARRSCIFFSGNHRCLSGLSGPGRAGPTMRPKTFRYPHSGAEFRSDPILRWKWMLHPSPVHPIYHMTGQNQRKQSAKSLVFNSLPGWIALPSVFIIPQVNYDRWPISYE